MSDDPSREPNTAHRDSAETAIAPNHEQTSAINLAWSAADPAPNVEAFADGHRPLPKTLLAFLAGVAIAAIALGAYELGQHEPAQVDTEPTQPTSTAPSPTPSAAFASPPAAAPQPTFTTSVPPAEPTPAPEPPPSAPEPAPPTIATPPPPVPDPLSPDDTFIARLQADGITFDNQAVAVGVAHQVCSAFSRGNSARDIAAAVKADNPSLPGNRAVDVVRLSVNAYCPQYGASS